LEVGAELTEEAGDVGGFEVDALDLVVGATAFDGGPIDDGSAGGDGVAHVGLLKDLVEASAGAAIGEELSGSEVGVACAVDEVEEAVLDGVGDGDAEVEVPGRGGSGEWMLDTGCWMGGMGFVMRDG
jgi:hypothetical protein